MNYILKSYWFLAGVALLLSFRWSDYWQAFSFNRTAMLAVGAFVSGDFSRVDEVQSALLGGDYGFKERCSAAWIEGIIAHWLGQEGARNSAWSKSLLCSEKYVQMIMALTPENIELATIAVTAQPHSAEAYFWLAKIYAGAEIVKAIELYSQGLHLHPDDQMRWQELGNLFIDLDYDTAIYLYQQQGLASLETKGNIEPFFLRAQIVALNSPQESIVLYRQGLERRPHDGQRWREFGDLLRDLDPQAAIQAYLQSCYNHDPGSQGCYRAGKTAESQGDLISAIHYYELSKFPGVREHAARLRRQLGLPQP